MSLENEKHIIAFSNGVQCSGLMNIHFAKTHFCSIYPNEDISIMELDSSNGSIIAIHERKNGEWTSKTVDIATTSL